MKKASFIFLIMIIFILFSFGGREASFSGLLNSANDNSDALDIMHKVNKRLAKRGLNIAVEAIEFFTIGRGRPSNRIHQQEFRWVPNDPRRDAVGDDITYLVDMSDGATTSGLTNTQTEAAIVRALTTWNTDKSLKKVDVIQVADPPGEDPDIFDDWFTGGGGYPFYADIVNAGWLPWLYFEIVGGPEPGGGDGILAFSVTYIFGTWDGPIFIPSDINGDNRLDTALNEVYYNDHFGYPGGSREGNPWGIDVNLPGIDVETVALHENGHSLGIGHFGPPPIAVMNPVYAGMRQSLYPIDRAGMNTVWGSWPNP